MAVHPVSLRLDETLKSRLEHAAKSEDRSMSFIAQKAIASYLDAQDHKNQIIAQALSEFEGETHVISGEAVSAWVNSWGSENELPMPRPDTPRNR